MVANIKNGLILKKACVLQKRKKVCEYYLNFLWDEGYILGYDNSDVNYIKIFLKYVDDEPVIKSIKVVSKPGHRIFYTVKQIWKIESTKNFMVFSTSRGVMSLLDCKKHNVGGEAVLMIT